MKILVTGAKGFVAGYLIEKLLDDGYEVVGLDNLSKYGEVTKTYDDHPKYTFYKGDAKDVNLLKKLLEDCDHFVNLAAMIGGVSFFHDFAFDLLLENDRINLASFEAGIWAYKNKKLKKITVISTSMVFDNCVNKPSKEGEELISPIAGSSYAFHKLGVEMYARTAFEQYGLPYTILRFANVYGVGEKTPNFYKNENRILAKSHVIPDLVEKILFGQYPLKLLGNGYQIRQYIHGSDVANGILLTLTNEKSINNDFNLADEREVTVLDLARLIFHKIKPDKEFIYTCVPSYLYDAQVRTVSTIKAKEILNFKTKVCLEDGLDEVIRWTSGSVNFESK